MNITTGLVIIGIMVLVIVGCVMYDHRRKPNSGAGALLVFTTIFAGIATFAGVAVGFLAPHQNLTGAIVMFIIAAFFLFVGIAGSRQLSKN